MAISIRESITRVVDLPRTDAVLMGRAELLAPGDRDLLEAVLIRNQPIAALSRIMNVNPSCLRKRVHRLTKRLTSRKFLDTARALAYLEREDARLAKLHFCQRVSLAQLAKREGVKLSVIRRRMEAIAQQIKTIKRLTQSGQAKLAS